MYEIVSFKDMSDPKGKPLGDLIPSSWVQKDGLEYVCYYPPAPYTDVQYLVKSQKKPNPVWQTFVINRHGTADTYKKGCERLERFLRKLSVHTTEEDENEQSTKFQMDPPNLNDVPDFPNNSPPLSLEAGECSRKKVHHCNSASSSGLPRQSRVKQKTTVRKEEPSKRAIISSDSDSESESPPPRKQKKYTTLGSIKQNTHKRAFSDSEYETPKKTVTVQGLNSENISKVSEVARADIFKSKRNSSVLLNESSTEESGPVKQNTHNKRAFSDSEYETPKKTETHCLNSENISKVSEVARADIFKTKRNSSIFLNESITEESDIKRLKIEVSDMKRSIVHEIRKLRTSFNECISTLQNFLRKQGGGELEVGKISEFEVGAKVTFPCKNEDDFLTFHNHLKEKENFDKFVHILRDLWITPNEKWTLKRSVTVILQRYMTKDVAKEYSGKGRSKLKKKDFSATLFFKALESAVVSAEARINIMDLTNAIGTALANARDWEGGRLGRTNKNNE